MMLPEIISLGVYNAELFHRTRETKRRKTTLFELELATENGGISYVDKESAPITKNTVICSKPGQLRHTRLPFKCYYIHMIVPEGELRDLLMSLSNFITVADRKRYEKLFLEILSYYNTSLTRDQWMLKSRLLELIYLLAEESEYHTFTSRASNKEVIGRVVSYIRENLTADLSLEAIAEYARFSPTHFHNCFKRSTGKTLRAFVESERLAKAINLLVSTDMTLSEIAYECGFSSQSYFSYAFKKNTGLTPRAYAREIHRRYEK